MMGYRNSQSTETKAKISRTKKGHSVSLVTRQKISRAKRGGHHSSEHKKKISVACTGLKRSSEFRKKMRGIVLDRKPTWSSSIERALEKSFLEESLDFEHNSSIFNCFRPDFVFRSKKLIVEADGDYWHSLPQKKKRDQQLDLRAYQEGWTVFHFTETRIKADLPSCISQVVAFLS